VPVVAVLLPEDLAVLLLAGVAVLLAVVHILP
jgi:hypothetical protein